LQVTEQEVVQVISRLGLQTVKEIRREIGAGDGCMCCHGDLIEYLAKHNCAAAVAG
jgi:bacterioferritin-associated ferredoxin